MVNILGQLSDLLDFNVWFYVVFFGCPGALFLVGLFVMWVVLNRKWDRGDLEGLEAEKGHGFEVLPPRRLDATQVKPNGDEGTTPEQDSVERDDGTGPIH